MNRTGSRDVLPDGRTAAVPIGATAGGIRCAGPAPLVRDRDTGKWLRPASGPRCPRRPGGDR
jgi:hypothetical protein